MDKKFVAWIIKRHEDLELEVKANFLLKLRNNPEGLQKIIFSRQAMWAIEAMNSIGRGIEQDIYRDPPEIVQFLREHFIKD